MQFFLVFTNEENEAESSKTKSEAKIMTTTKTMKRTKRNENFRIGAQIQTEENLLKFCRGVAMRRRATTCPDLKRKGTAQMKPTEDAYFVV